MFGAFRMTFSKVLRQQVYTIFFYRKQCFNHLVWVIVKMLIMLILTLKKNFALIVITARFRYCSYCIIKCAQIQCEPNGIKKSPCHHPSTLTEGIKDSNIIFLALVPTSVRLDKSVLSMSRSLSSGPYGEMEKEEEYSQLVGE